MSHIKITVDGKTLMDADPGTWRHTPPDIPAIQQRTAGEPWGLAVMSAVAHAATLGMLGEAGDTTIDVTTRAGGFTMEADGVGPVESAGVPARVPPPPAAPPAHAATEAVRL
ncbi:MFS transporter [Mycobacteroides abscessus]|uniref:MFS transporter n=1 Tax=Mycobacteroides abscessus TaxID=36809 RepID=UPI0007F9510D|nr:MFS transporter [Mycobacteroides abscessus]ANN98191.1 MFS transporter [Mycobacteroides abscessus]